MKYLFFIFSLVLLVSCSGNLEDKKKNWDKLYGYCDNPQRDIKGYEYYICKQKERAAGPSGRGETQEGLSLSEFFSRDKNSGVLMPTVNQYLWLGALEVTAPFDLKIADNTGGLIQTEWIINPSLPDERCIIKVQVLSPDLISTGVKTGFICEKLIDDVWQSDGQEYIQEEKQITLKILESARQYSAGDV